MSVLIQYANGHLEAIDASVAACGQPMARDLEAEAAAWAAAAADHLWLADRDEMLALAAASDAEIVDNPIDG